MSNPWQIPGPARHLSDDVSPIRARAVQTPPASVSEQLYGRLLQQRIVFLGEEVDDPIANRLCSELLLLSAEDAKRDIWLYINSPGGSVSAGMALYDMMQYIPNDVATVAMGFAGSMAQILLTAGAPGKRYALPHSRIMMHQPSGGIGGTASDVAIQAEQMIYAKQTLAEIIARHSDNPIDQIRTDFDRDRWFTAEEAKDYGLIDQVIPSTARVATS
ncbi:ATP-dependent Clp protease protease subunit [Thermocatellispora tengchongensis]|uniref:ATP-dependent Clp protease proteolytic subunit n=1 Tax=Thermocatellispora tengchongensis TaxID=1073253 RepID=A0A840PJA7_9ACTN|nr:ATP-dependent Clp protease proteolytic subunit [Thermocatellispora tengchongensis]MBB5139049.1 ATP-dependent Clp protease protease subunit [Thermocatellispora tengchongensis]